MAKITFNPFEYLRDKKDLSDGGEPVEKKIEQQTAPLFSEDEIELRRYVQTEFPKIFKECYDRFSKEIDYVYEPVGKVDYKGENLNTFEYIERLVREHYNIPFSLDRYIQDHTEVLFYSEPIEFGFTHKNQSVLEIPEELLLPHIQKFGDYLPSAFLFSGWNTSRVSSKILKKKIVESVEIQKEYTKYSFEARIKRFFLQGRCNWKWIQIDQFRAYGFQHFPNCMKDENAQLVYGLDFFDKRKAWSEELIDLEPDHPIFVLWQELSGKDELDLTVDDHVRWHLEEGNLIKKHYSKYVPVYKKETGIKTLTTFHPAFGELELMRFQTDGLKHLVDSGYNDVYLDYLKTILPGRNDKWCDVLHPFGHFPYYWAKLELDDVIDDPARIAAILETYQEPENRLREKFGLPKIGEGWISETNLYYEIKEAFPQVSVIHHGKPKWLGKQHLDIWIPEYNIGIEYQGDQHFFPVDFFGGKQALKKNKERDARKKALCEDNECKLVYVLPGYDLEEVISEVGGHLT